MITYYEMDGKTIFNSKKDLSHLFNVSPAKIVFKRKICYIRIMREETRQDILSAGEIGAKYDQAAKILWRNREILAPLLKYAVEELRDESVESIMKLIDADSISEDAAVSDLPPAVTALANELGSTTEKLITYDFKFNIKNPKLSSEKILILLHIDLEFQNKYRPFLLDGRSYPLVKRGIYYGAREISAQLGRITNQTNYADVEKVISIWIVNEGIPAELQNTATRYYIRKEDFIGVTNEPQEDYDLLEVVIIRRGEKGNITEPIFQYLKSVFEANIDEIDKYTPASDNPKLKEEVTKMPGMSQVIFERGYDEGLSQGLSEGIKQGKAQGLKQGIEQGKAQGLEQGIAQGKAQGLEQGKAQGLEQGKAQGLEQGKAQGLEQGITQGQKSLIYAIQRLRRGENREDILAEGIDEHTIELAQSIL